MAWLARGWMVVILCSGCGAGASDESEPGADGSSSEAGSSEESGSSTGTPDGPECLDADASLSLSLGVSVGYTQGPCVAAEVSGTRLRVTCEGDAEGPGEIVVDLDVSPPVAIALEVGAMVEVESFTNNTHAEPSQLLESVIVREAATQQLVLAAITSNELDWTSELAPLQLEPVADACSAVVDASNCSEKQRLIW
ncbi:MAG TPA: hypothetical protein VG755_06465, partial [Nannocystaceae bacterium]|nr:hypothetical protein [Nannocystaceae bacterium]